MLRLSNADVEEAERKNAGPSDEPELDDAADETVCRSFFDLRQRTLLGMDQVSAFHIVSLGLLRKLQASSKGIVLYREVEDCLNRYLRLLDADMQKFVSLHEILRDAVDENERRTKSSEKQGDGANEAAAAASAAALQLLHEGMREIAVVLLACSKMQTRALDLKTVAQRSISDDRSGTPGSVSFGRFAEFVEKALALLDQLRRKHEELQQLRIRAMACTADARVAAASAGGASSASGSASPAAAASGAPTAVAACEGRRE